jgi:DNA-binding transcriptional ArsR family regulator
VSEHMRVLVSSGLIDATRIKQWIFYRRNEKTIAAFKRSVRDNL